VPELGGDPSTPSAPRRALRSLRMTGEERPPRHRHPERAQRVEGSPSSSARCSPPFRYRSRSRRVRRSDRAPPRFHCHRQLTLPPDPPRHRGRTRTRGEAIAIARGSALALALGATATAIGIGIGIGSGIGIGNGIGIGIGIGFGNGIGSGIESGSGSGSGGGAGTRGSWSNGSGRSDEKRPLPGRGRVVRSCGPLQIRAGRGTTCSSRRSRTRPRTGRRSCRGYP